MNNADMKIESPTWPHVLHFARDVEAQLDGNRQKGDREGWLRQDPEQHVNHAMRHVAELAEAIRQGASVDRVRHLAADAAARLMMASDTVLHRAK